MKRLLVLFVIFLSLSGRDDARAQQRRLSGSGLVSTDCFWPPCGPTLWAAIPTGATVSDAVTWEYAGVVGPWYGAYAQRYHITGFISGIQLYLTQDPDTPNFTNGRFETYIWTDFGGMPGVAIWRMSFPVVSPPPSFWPAVDCYNFGWDQPVYSDEWIWIGCWPAWPNAQAEWFIAADTNWPGTPMTNYAPGIGYPTGWGPPIWPSPGDGGAGSGSRTLITAFGIGAWGTELEVPTQPTSWGRIKSLYRDAAR